MLSSPSPLVSRALKAEVICAVLAVDPVDPSALVTWARLSSPLDPSALIIELAAFEAQLLVWLCAWIKADKVSFENCADGVLDAEDAVVAADVAEAVADPVELAELEVRSVENCPVRLERSLCRLLSICCRADMERSDDPETCMVSAFLIFDRAGGGPVDNGADRRRPQDVRRKFRAGGFIGQALPPQRAGSI